MEKEYIGKKNVNKTGITDNRRIRNFIIGTPFQQNRLHAIHHNGFKTQTVIRSHVLFFHYEPLSTSFIRLRRDLSAKI